LYVPPIYISYLNRLDIDELQIADDEILAAVEAGLASQGRDEAVIEPRVHLEPRFANGHFNVLRGAIKAPVDSAGVKIVGDFVDNYKLGFPSELGVLVLLDPRTGAPKAILDASGITDMRTGAVTAIGAKHLARKDAKVLGHIGARGTAYWNVRLLNHLLNLNEIRVHSRREESRNAFAERLERDLGTRVIADWQSCVEGADIVVEASRLDEPAPLLKTEWIKTGALVVPYGTMSAVELTLTDIMDKLVVDHWGSARLGSSAACVPMSRRGNSPSTHCMPSSGKSSPARSPAARVTTRRSCSGIAACRCRTLHSAMRCWRRPRGSASASGFASHERHGRAVHRQRPHVFGQRAGARGVG